MRNGDYQTAARQYHDLLTLPVDQEVAAQARFGLGTAYLREGAYTSAIDVFREFLARTPAQAGDGREMHEAHFLLAEALVGVGDPLMAAEEYRAYLSGGTVITAYVNQSLGAVLQAAGEYPQAAEAYQAAVVESPELPFEVFTRERLALVHVAQLDYAAAIDQYEAILQVARVEAYRARIEHQAAETLLLAGETETGAAEPDSSGSVRLRVARVEVREGREGTPGKDTEAGAGGTPEGSTDSGRRGPGRSPAPPAQLYFTRPAPGGATRGATAGTTSEDPSQEMAPSGSPVGPRPGRRRPPLPGQTSLWRIDLPGPGEVEIVAADYAGNRATARIRIGG